MESILTPVIIDCILDQLDKDSIFNFIYSCNELSNFSYYIHNKYKFNYDLVKNTHMLNKIKYLYNINDSDIGEIASINPIIKGFYEVKYDPSIELNIKYKKMVHSMIINSNPPNLKQYSNLKKITINYELFNETLDFLPESIEEINIDSMMFNQKIKNNFPNLKKLSIDSLSFNSKISKKIIVRVKIVFVRSPTYTQKQYVYAQHHRFLTLMNGMSGIAYNT